MSSLSKIWGRRLGTRLRPWNLDPTHIWGRSLDRQALSVSLPTPVAVFNCGEGWPQDDWYDLMKDRLNPGTGSRFNAYPYVEGDAPFYGDTDQFNGYYCGYRAGNDLIWHDSPTDIIFPFMGAEDNHAMLFSFWARASSSGTTEGTLQFHSGNGSPNRLEYLDDDTLFLTINQDSMEWDHYMVWVSNLDLRMFVNGVESGANGKTLFYTGGLTLVFDKVDIDELTFFSIDFNNADPSVIETYAPYIYNFGAGRVYDTNLNQWAELLGG